MAREIVAPGLPTGTRDFMPEQVAQRRRIVDKVIGVYKLFGFVPLETPILERKEVLTGNNPDFRMEIFEIEQKSARINIVDGDEEAKPLALRFDLTVPLSRFIAMRKDQLPMPFKRYQLGPVFRGEKVQKGRYRQFDQLDADIVGSDSVMADMEVIAMIYNVMIALGIEDFLVRVNTRKILNALPFYAGFDQSKIVTVLRILDKLDKIGLDGVATELAKEPDDQFDTRYPDLKPQAIARLMDFIAIKGNPDSVIGQLFNLMSTVPQAKDGLDELAAIADGMPASGIDPNRWTLEPSIVRGLEYYTGPVFETVLTSLPGFGSVFSGGRFDDLIGSFIGYDIPATGASIGVDRLFAALEELNVLKEQRVSPDVMICMRPEVDRVKGLEIATMLRQAGISAELYLGQEKRLGAQIGLASNNKTPFVIILGPDEIEAGKASLKELSSGQQETLDKSEICSKIQEKLNIM